MDKDFEDMRNQLFSFTTKRGNSRTAAVAIPGPEKMKARLSDDEFELYRKVNRLFLRLNIPRYYVIGMQTPTIVQETAYPVLAEYQNYELYKENNEFIQLKSFLDKQFLLQIINHPNIDIVNQASPHVVEAILKQAFKEQFGDVNAVKPQINKTNFGIEPLDLLENLQDMHDFLVIIEKLRAYDSEQLNSNPTFEEWKSNTYFGLFK